MMKIKLLLILLFYSNFLISQNINHKDSITVLKEVLITKNKKTKKNENTLKLDGFPRFSGINEKMKIVSLVKNIPSGRLKFIKFYFNTGLVNLLKKKLDISYKDTELQLLIYELDSVGLPGKIISNKDIKFIVKKDFSGEYTLNVSALNIVNKELYIGFEVLSEVDKNLNNLYIRYNEKENAKTFIMKNESHIWVNYCTFTPFHFKMKIVTEDFILDKS